MNCILMNRVVWIFKNLQSEGKILELNTSYTCPVFVVVVELVEVVVVIIKIYTHPYEFACGF